MPFAVIILDLVAVKLIQPDGLGVSGPLPCRSS
jgi:hypothetical protein